MVPYVQAGAPGTSEVGEMRSGVCPLSRRFWYFGEIVRIHFSPR